MRLGGRSPRHETFRIRRGENQDVVKIGRGPQPFLEPAPGQLPGKSRGGKIGRLGVVNVGGAHVVLMADDAEIVLLILQIGAVVAPVVPNGEGNPGRHIEEKEAREIPALRRLVGTPAQLVE